VEVAGLVAELMAAMVAQADLVSLSFVTSGRKKVLVEQ
jgi:hypothetical protein